MRADSKPQPPHQSSSPSGRRRPAGRPCFFEQQALMEVWLAVEEYRARHRSSVNMACKKLSLPFLIAGTKAADRDYTITGEVLRDYYYRAKQLLTIEQDERNALVESLRAIGASSPQEHSPLPLASFWQDQLAARLAELVPD